MENLGVFGLIHLIIVVYAGLQIINSKADTIAKIIWLLVVTFAPVFGVIIWYLIGPGTPKK